MQILLLTPIKKEYQAVRKHLTNLQSLTKENCNYEVGTFKGKHQPFQIAIRQTGSKNTTVALATEKAYQHFRPAVILLVGIAGGVKDVHIGDVVVGTKAYGYAAGKEKTEGHLARPNVQNFSPILLSIAERVDKENTWVKRCDNLKNTPTVFFAPIASDDKVIATTDGTAYRILKKNYNDTAALEMESIGFAEAAYQHPQLHALNIRGISDLLNHKTKADEAGSQEQAAAIAAAFAFELIYQLDLKQLQLPTMDIKELTKEVLQYIQPQLDQLQNKDTVLPTNPKELLVWKKVKPSIEEEIAELKNDPTDAITSNSIPGIIRKYLKNNNNLQEELVALVRQLKEADSTDDFNISDSENVFINSNLQSEGDVHVGNKNSTTNYNNVDKVWNIEENKGDFNFDQSNNSKQQIESPTKGSNQYNVAENKGTINIINIPQTLSSSDTISDKSTTVQKIHTLISKNKIKKAIELLLQMTKNGESELHNQVILLANRWNRLQGEKLGGTTTIEQSNIQQNQILMAILNFVEEL